MNTDTDKILTLEEVADYLKVTRRTMYRLVQQGQVPAFKLGGSWRFRRGELERWIAQKLAKQRAASDEEVDR